MSETLARPLNVLIVEDSEDDAYLLYSELAHAGSQLHYRRVECAEEMRRALGESEWDIVISDHSMPRFSSTEAHRVLIESGKDIPFIIYSSYIKENIAVSAMREGVHDYIQKGNLARLLPVIERELKGAKMRHAKRAAETQVRHLELYDELTGLPNRNLFCQAAALDLAAARSGSRGMALCHIDLDRFMRINNSFGYATGDALLRQVAARFKDCVGEDDCVARLSGDTFALVSPKAVDAMSANLLVGRVMDALADPFVVNGIEFFISLSVGVSLYPEHGADLATLMVNAESAMVLAKKLGGGNFKHYVKGMNAALGESLTLESALRHATERNELRLHYQPSVDLASGAIVGVEALVRWQHPQHGLLSPEKFIPLADETGLITEIGEWVLQEACRQTKAWHQMGFDSLTVAVNVSAVQFGQQRLLEHVASMLADSGLPPHALVLEITESVLMQDAEANVATLADLKRMGVRIAMDDFGTGYSSLSYLKRFPIDVLKIDKSFIRDVALEGDDAAIVRAIIALGKSLRLTLIAEGVESVEQKQFLLGEKCERAQGYLFSEPVWPQAISEMLRAGRQSGPVRRTLVAHAMTVAG
jgi:diguanylate cyclase (GGDEF)-like protein